MAAVRGVVSARMIEPLRSDLDHASRWPAFEAVRGVAAVGVVVYHLLRLLAPAGEWADALPRPLWWLAGGRLGVDVFFVLSGFLVVQSWESARRRAGSVLGAAAEFTRKRIVRVFPAYWLSVIVFVPWFAPHLLSTEHLGDLALFATAQSYWRDGLTNQVNTVYWTLTTETDFYVLAGVVALLLRHRLGWPLAALTAYTSTLWLHGELAPWRGELPPGSLGGRLDQFVIGAVVARAVLVHESGARSRLVAVVGHRLVGPLVAVALLAACQWHGSDLFAPGRLSWGESAFHPMFAALVAVAIVHVAVSPPAWMSGRWIRLPGVMSYSLYLWHYPLLVWALDRADLRGRGFGVGLGGATSIVFVLLAIAAVTVTSYLAAERWVVARRDPHVAPQP